MSDIKESFIDKVQDLREAKLMVKDRKTGKMYDPHKELKKLLHHPETVAQFKRMKDEKGRGWPVNKNFEKK
jgi:hypothetical protein